MKSLLILGRQPALGLAELESLYGSDSVRPVGKGGALLDIDYGDIDFKRLGGSIKLAEVLQIIGTTQWHDIEPHLESIVSKLAGSLTDGKIRLGISTYGIQVRANDINRTGLVLKKSLKSSSHSVRVVPNKFPELNSAQVLHNQLTGPTGIEIVIARDGDRVIIAHTRAEQDIEAYARRDQGRPMRDAKVGMLPPKLAQIIINLAHGSKSNLFLEDRDEYLLDPFCGTGVLLQEAMLMDLPIIGTDIDPRMIEYTKANLEWLIDITRSIVPPKGFYELAVGDATNHRWKKRPSLVACETYLGKPLTSLPPKHILDQIMAECDEIHEKFLENIATQLLSGTRLCIAVPAWKTKNGFLHLKTLAKLQALGYNRQKFVHARDEDLIYHRPDQIVARELVVLTKQ